jgi:hypothetical protein
MDVADLKVKQAKEAHVKQLFAIAAQYICLAYALQPHKEVYRKSLQVGRGRPGGQTWGAAVEAAVYHMPACAW